MVLSSNTAYTTSLQNKKHGFISRDFWSRSFASIGIGIRGCSGYFYLPHPSHDWYTGKIKSLLSHHLKSYQVVKMIKAKVKAKFFYLLNFIDVRGLSVILVRGKQSTDLKTERKNHSQEKYFSNGGILCLVFANWFLYFSPCALFPAVTLPGYSFMCILDIDY